MIHAILETAEGVKNVDSIATASPRMHGMSLGPADLAASRGMKTTRVGGGHPEYRVIADPAGDQVGLGGIRRGAQGDVGLATREVGETLVEKIHWWEEYTRRNRMEMNNNPSPGNKAGGLTTILEKSLGAAAKGGTTPLNGVYKYAEPVTARGFTFMDSPGYDPASVTGQIASGCNLVAFTTGRGSAFGSKPSPSIKIATNSEMYGRMTEDMDVNAGRILTGEATVEEVGREIYELLLRIASGEKSKSEAQGLGDYEFVPWQIGAVM